MSERGCYSLMIERNNNRKTDIYLGYEQFSNKMNYKKLNDCIKTLVLECNILF